MAITDAFDNSAVAVPDKEVYVGSDGTIEVYEQVYKPTQEEIEDAEKWENFILAQQSEAESSMIAVGMALHEFNERKLYLATGHPSLFAWMSQPMFKLSYEHGTRLMRIARDLVPILGEDTKDWPLGTLKELLPMARDDNWSEDAIRRAAEDVKGLNVRDASKYLKELRGIKLKEAPLTLRAIMSEGTEYINIKVVGHRADGRAYDMGKLSVHKADFATFKSTCNGAWLWEDEVK